MDQRAQASRFRGATGPLLAGALLLAAGCPTTDGSCETAALCDPGQLCHAGRCVAALEADPACTPPTSGTLGSATLSTPAPVACDVATPSTWPRPVPPALPPGWTLPLEVDGLPVAGATAEALTGQTISFVVPPSTSSLTIHHQGVAAAASFDFTGYPSPIPNMVGPLAVRAPSGGEVFSGDFLSGTPIDPSLRSVSYLLFTPWGSSFTLPQTSRLNDLALSRGGLPPGRWSFRVSDWNAQCDALPSERCQPRAPAAGEYDVAVVARPGPYVSTGTLDVGIYLAGAGAISAASAVASPGHQRFVWALGQFLGRAGICLGAVTYFDLPAWAPSTPAYDEEPPCSDLARLFSLASPTVDGVHLFLVDDFTPTGQGILGIDGSIPGPSGLPGSIHSGAAMVSGDIGANQGSCPAGALDVDACGSDAAGYIAAHEIGHWLGLYHTTEATGDQFDPLDDTPTCGCGSCAGFPDRFWCGDPVTPALMAPEWCLQHSGACSGGENLMFWSFDPLLSRGDLSAEQALVMRVNPAVK